MTVRVLLLDDQGVGAGRPRRVQDTSGWRAVPSVAASRPIPIPRSTATIELGEDPWPTAVEIDTVQTTGKVLRAALAVIRPTEREL